MGWHINVHKLIQAISLIAQRSVLQVEPRVIWRWWLFKNNEQSFSHVAFQHARNGSRSSLLSLSPPLSTNTSVLQIISHTLEVKSSLVTKNGGLCDTLQISKSTVHLFFYGTLYCKTSICNVSKNLPEQTLESIEYKFTSFILENSLWLCFKIQEIFYIRWRVKRKQMKYEDWVTVSEYLSLKNLSLNIFKLCFFKLDAFIKQNTINKQTQNKKR